MPDWLQNSFLSDSDVSTGTLAIRLAAAFAFGCVVALIYRKTHGRSADATPGLSATLVLLAILIAMVTMVIGSNVARAFSLVGALAIVRFRTTVEDTRDTAFVIFAVAVGMAVGAGSMKVPLVGVPVAAIAAFVFRPRHLAGGGGSGGGGGGGGVFTLIVRFGLGQTDEPALLETIRKSSTSTRLSAAGTARSGAALERTYTVHLRCDEDATALVAALNALPGAQSVELQRT